MTHGSLTELESQDAHGFVRRHIGPGPEEQREMLALLGLPSLEALAEQVIPADIRLPEDPSAQARYAEALGDGLSEAQMLDRLRALAGRNQVFRSWIGLGYHNTHTPPVILRNVLENPGWYTAYTPYQPEISQGRLEALLNFQTMVADLTGLDLANASLLDEATAAAEAMTLCRRASRNRDGAFFVAGDCLPQTLAVIRTRAEPLGIEVIVGDPADGLPDDALCGALFQYPNVDGEVRDLRPWCEQVRAGGGLAVVAADLLALTLLTPPGELGADVAVGSSQRFGVPPGFGGPHAAYFATRDAHKRALPGRLVGVSRDSAGRPAYRLALQTREQHIRREKATSNICTAQALLAVMASMYAVYHGPAGLTRIARRVHRLSALFVEGLRRLGYAVPTAHFFDTVTVATGGPESTARLHALTGSQRINLRRIDGDTVGVSFDETTTRADVETLWRLFDEARAGGSAAGQVSFTLDDLDARTADALPPALLRDTGRSPFLTHPVFNRYRSETEMLRYLRLLMDRDLALDRAMIPLGSCTMKLNASAEMLPVSWPEFAQLHPFAPAEQSAGYRALCEQLQAMLCACTGYDAVSLQPNSGAQGEYAGLLAIRAYHHSRGDARRDICLIPSSAHGTNPASAQMAGMQVVVVACDSAGNVDLEDLAAKAGQHADRLAALMVTYPSTHGVFETAIREICALIHRHGGQVYLDGANLNAQVGLCAPGEFGADVSHLNLHKTFCIPHGGGGPGVGPIGVRSHLAPFLPEKIGAVAAAPYGSAGILPISWAYIALMGAAGLRQASAVAILNANYIAERLRPHYPVLYSGAHGRVAHECILDLRPLKDSAGVSVDDVAKRLIDYGFHAPTMSWPVAGTLMVEPTESEAKAELDRFCDAMIAIRDEIREIENGEVDPTDNLLTNAPHTAQTLSADVWAHPYSRQRAGYPLAASGTDKYWPPVGRIDNVYGDRHLVCSCPPLSAYAEPEDGRTV